jgi:Na+-transporting NADH:ubiquinone oxidoreductase subunit A
MGKLIKLRRGKDIKLEGETSLEMAPAQSIRNYAIKPTDFNGIVPKILVKPGDEVKAGTPLFHSKKNAEILFCSPVSGEIADVVRGDRRLVLEVRILADAVNKYESFPKENPSSLGREQILERLKQSGCWPLIRQRPFNIIADPQDEPKSIFISSFDTAPLAPDYNYILKDQAVEFQTGLNALVKLTAGKVYLNLKKGANNCDAFAKANGVETFEFEGPHPAGNVGIQIHHIDPINKGDVVWVVNPQDVAVIGRLFIEGRYINEKLIALAGSEVKNRKYHKVFSGASIETLVQNNISESKNRFISGNVLTGTQIEQAGYLGFYDNVVTVIPEGDHYEFMGWLIPSYPRPSVSKTFPYYLTPDKKFKVNTNFHGEERAFVMTGEYDKVLPMDVLPVPLLKAILAADFDNMESLGIYEVVEEDLALCEFVCTSKINAQKILRDGLDMLMREG